MRISLYTPDFSVEELNRFHLTANDACLLGAVGIENEKALGESRKRLSNISARDGLIPFEKSGTGKTSPNLYSVKSALMFRCVDDLTRNNNNKKTFEYAAEIAAAVGEVAETLVANNDDLHDIDVAENLNWYVAYGSYGKASPKIIEPGKFTPGNIMRGGDAGIYAAGELTWNILRSYPDYWADNRVATGLDRLPRYRGCDLDGNPLDPNHPWNRDLPPLERAKRLVEIEEYIAALEAKEGADNA